METKNLKMDLVSDSNMKVSYECNKCGIQHNDFIQCFDSRYMKSLRDRVCMCEQIEPAPIKEDNYMSMPYMERLGEGVKKLRLEKGWKQVELARRAGIDGSNICNIESVKSKHTSFYNVLQIAKGFNMPIDEFLIFCGFVPEKKRECRIPPEATDAPIKEQALVPPDATEIPIKKTCFFSRKIW